MNASAGLWASFSHDPRVPAHAVLRASDQDRNLIQQVLAEGYADGRLDREEFDTRAEQAAAARTLGQLPPLVADLVAGPDSDAQLARVPEDLQGRAVAKYESDRREAFLGFLGPSLICVMIWAVLGMGWFWPAFVIAGTGINLVRTLVLRQDMIESNRRKLERKREKRLRELEAGDAATDDEKDETDGSDEKDGSE